MPVQRSLPLLTLTLAIGMALACDAIAQTNAGDASAGDGLRETEDAATPPAAELDRVRVIGAARPLSSFPGAVDVLEGATLRDARRAVDLSEALPQVPGLSVLDRGNYAQDLQLQSRGFGARSTFGIRGLRLVVDGVPASASDGQGQAATFPLDTLDRIEVLRGPLALLYGNAAGGVVVGSTEPDGGPGTAIDGWLGSDDARRLALRGDGGVDDWAWRVGASTFATGGARPHSAAERHQANVTAQWSRDPRTRLKFSAQWLDQPDTQDPLGLTRDGLRACFVGNREDCGDPVARRFDTRKRIGNRQLGLRWESEYRDGRSAWAGTYGVGRDVVQFLSIPPAAQAAPSSAGGVIDLARTQFGVDAGHRWAFARGALALGFELGQLDEDRRGYENFIGTTLGVRGRLRRDEANRIEQREAYGVGEWSPVEGWNVLAGVRHARLHFASRDAFLANGDDSGTLRYARTAASLGVARTLGRGEVFASVGRGFETPTVTELAYRPDGAPGFNRDLRPARIESGELGWRWRGDDAHASVALYRIDGFEEIVPADSRGGRASFTNAGRTRREGVELGLQGALRHGFGYVLTANALDARFTAPFAYTVTTGGASQLRTVASGNRIPGVPRADGYAELAWRRGDGALSAALEGRFSAGLPVDDRNSERSAGRGVLNLRAAIEPPSWRGVHAFARVDNLFDRDHVGSVIVNEGNGRYFEPADGRSFTVGIGWRR